MLFIKDIPPPVYTNVANNTQAGESENGNVDTTQHNPVHSPTSPQVPNYY